MSDTLVLTTKIAQWEKRGRRQGQRGRDIKKGGLKREGVPRIDGAGRKMRKINTAF